MTAHEAIRIRRMWIDDVLVLDAVDGLHIGGVGERFGINMSAPPESFVFEMQIFPVAAAPTPAIQPLEAGLQLERVYLPPFRPRDLYAADTF